MNLPRPTPLLLIPVAIMFGCAAAPAASDRARLEQRYKVACERSGFVSESDVAKCVARGAGYQTAKLPERQCVSAVGKQIVLTTCY